MIQNLFISFRKKFPLRQKQTANKVIANIYQTEQQKVHIKTQITKKLPYIFFILSQVYYFKQISKQ